MPPAAAHCAMPGFAFPGQLPEHYPGPVPLRSCGCWECVQDDGYLENIFTSASLLSFPLLPLCFKPYLLIYFLFIKVWFYSMIQSTQQGAKRKRTPVITPNWDHAPHNLYPPKRGLGNKSYRWHTQVAEASSKFPSPPQVGNQCAPLPTNELFQRAGCTRSTVGYKAGIKSMEGLQ